VTPIPAETGAHLVGMLLHAERTYPQNAQSQEVRVCVCMNVCGVRGFSVLPTYTYHTVQHTHRPAHSHKHVENFTFGHVSGQPTIENVNKMTACICVRVCE